MKPDLLPGNQGEFGPESPKLPKCRHNWKKKKMAIDHVTHLIIVDCQPLNSNQLPNGKKENLKSVMKGLQVASELADFFLM